MSTFLCMPWRFTLLVLFFFASPAATSSSTTTTTPTTTTSAPVSLRRHAPQQRPDDEIMDNASVRTNRKKKDGTEEETPPPPPPERRRFRWISDEPKQNKETPQRRNTKSIKTKQQPSSLSQQPKDSTMDDERRGWPGWFPKSTETNDETNKKDGGVRVLKLVEDNDNNVASKKRNKRNSKADSIDDSKKQQQRPLDALAVNPFDQLRSLQPRFFLRPKESKDIEKKEPNKQEELPSEKPQKQDKVRVLRLAGEEQDKESKEMPKKKEERGARWKMSKQPQQQQRQEEGTTETETSPTTTKWPSFGRLRQDASDRTVETEQHKKEDERRLTRQRAAAEDEERPKSAAADRPEQESDVRQRRTKEDAAVTEKVPQEQDDAVSTETMSEGQAKGLPREPEGTADAQKPEKQKAPTTVLDTEDTEPELTVRKLQLAETSSTEIETSKPEEKSEPADKSKKAPAVVPSDLNQTSPVEPVQATTLPSTNASTAAQGSSASPQGQVHFLHPQQQQPSMIILGSPDGYPPRGSVPQGARRTTSPPTPTTSTILIEALASIISAALRIWFLTTLTKWWTEEEQLRPMQHFVWERLDDRYAKDMAALDTVLQCPPLGVSERRWRYHLRREQRQERKLAAASQLTNGTGRNWFWSPLASNAFGRTVVVVELRGDEEKGGQLNLSYLQQVVTFLLSQHRRKAFGTHSAVPKELEVVFLVESPGGAVQDFGLAASQVNRLSEEEGITTTACVDKVAASGGFMVASQAHRIFAAPFAIVGSIGVIRESFNLYGALEKYGVRPLVLKAGDSKAPLTTFGPVTKKDLVTAQRTLDSMHDAFQKLVIKGRPMLADSVNEVCTGDTYLGQEAESLSLVDRVVTSEEYILERIIAGDRVLKLHRSHHHLYARNRRLFSPLDFIIEKSRAWRSAFSKLLATNDVNVESVVSKIVTASTAISFAKYLARKP